MSFSLEFNVLMQWKDYRLGFQNLKEYYFQNQVTDEKALSLWTPQPVFSNTYSRKTVQYTPSTSILMLVGNGSSHEAPLTQLDEAKVYYTKETELRLKTSHYLDFKCDFDLKYFPFDYQTCFVEVSTGKVSY